MVESRPIDRYRVVQWATGNIGTRSLREIIGHPDLDLVGLWVSSPAKVGRDAGDLSGLDVVTDVVATDDIEAVLALDADCVMYMPQGLDLDALCRILESGANVVTTRGEFHHPASLDPSTRERIEAACARGGHVDPQHGVEPRLHHRGRHPGGRLVRAPHRSATRSSSSRTCRAGTRPT